MKTRIFQLIILVIFFAVIACEQEKNEEKNEDISTNQEEGFTANTDELKVPDYSLPDAFVQTNGSKITNNEQWWNNRRPEILNTFATQVYGKIPDKAYSSEYEVVKENKSALNGFATMKEIKATFSNNKGSHNMRLLIYQPNHVKGAVPCFLGLNFYGNHTIYPDPAITLSDQWSRNNIEYGFVDHQATEKSRGVRVDRWPLEKILMNGFALATIYYGDLDPDKNNPVDFSDGIHPLFYDENQSKPDSSEWGAISAWAWGLSRALDYFETDAAIDAKKVAVFGHSRLGKAALWAGANDQRFAMVISNNSGCGGAALSRRAFGETVARINQSFPHWFSDNFNKYNENESDLPVDQHLLIALMAPRPVYIASAEEDLWADPRGEFLSAHHADTVYKFLGEPGLPVDEMPELNEPVKGTIGYHIRSGGHDIRPFDWQQYIDFANKHLKN